MADDTPTPPQTNFLPAFLTASGSAVVGQDVAGDTIQSLVWFTSQWCGCTPPASVEHLYKAVVTLAFVGVAFLFHYLYAKRSA